MSNSELEQRRQAATPRGVGVMCDFYASRAENATLWDVDGREFTDFSAGIAVLNTGHRHPRLLEAIRRQLDCFTHTAYQIVPYASYITLAEKINALVPITGPVKSTFFTTGAEAVENAVKIARAYTRRPGIITFGGAFHGRTLLTLALTGKVAPYKLGFGPFPGQVFHAQYPNALHGVSVDDAIASIQRLFQSDISPDQVAAILFEPIQGEGGFNIAPSEFIVALRKLCDQHGILLIADEVQSGFARTGKLFAMEHCAGVKADLITLAKSLGGGMPISAVAGRAEVMDAPGPGGLGGTYAGNPVAVASALAVLEVIEEENLCQRARQLGSQLMDTLEQLKIECPAMAQVRGQGSMVAVEFYSPKTGEPDAAYARKIQSQALAQGLLLLTCGVHGNVIRFLYPLTIPAAQFNAALDLLKRLLTAKH
ncbi:4-aminobutyrate--2-oxoglutarate transaminase [Biostraticola tofi]|uniref:4-aminobutyrate aminotransferase n=1 Tax=Biostraticola tofi TaxID=466109 RepID=A0A4R3YRM8_9GAMM|nr:4-aminobutyrate--2-oxoglutarate transaminase [Biostraticola tofi]TCV95081.1 4-aminobutyrate aminotransferase [Biostraticola tofi]